MLQPAYPIITARLRLRPYTPDDLDALHAIQSRPDVMRYLYGEPRSRAEVADALAARAQHPTLEREGDILFLATERRDSGAVIGDVSLRWLSARHRQGQTGFALHPDRDGRGYAREAAVEMLRRKRVCYMGWQSGPHAAGAHASSHSYTHSPRCS